MYPQVQFPQGLTLQNVGQSRNYSGVSLVLSQNLVLNNDASLTLENGELFFNIFAYDGVVIMMNQQSTLTLRNCVITLSQPLISNSQITGSSHLIMQNTVRNGAWFVLYNSAQITCIDGDSAGFTLITPYTGKVTVANQPSVWLELYMPSPSTITMDNVPGSGDTITPQFVALLNTIYAPASISFTNSQIREIDLGIFDNVWLTVSNTNTLSVGWSIGVNDGVTYSVSGLKPQLFADNTWKIANSSLRLVNTKSDSALVCPYLGSLSVLFLSLASC